LRFECTRCGECCRTRGEYAHVYLNDDEVADLARFLGMTRERFERQYTFEDGGWRELRFHSQECVFLTPEGTCGVYPARPVQCRTFPFWPDLVRGDRFTRRAQSLCEGVGEGRLHSPEEVAARVQEYRDAQQDED
jgi:hypothetical protein